MTVIQDIAPRPPRPANKQRLYQRVILNEVVERVKRHLPAHGQQAQSARQYAFTARKAHANDQEIGEFLARFKQPSH